MVQALLLLSLHNIALLHCFIIRKNKKNKLHSCQEQTAGWSSDFERRSQSMAVKRLSAISYLTGWAKVMAFPS